MQYIKFFAIAIILSCKDFILDNEFTVILEHFQEIKDHIDINAVIKITNRLIETYEEVDFYEEAAK